MRDTQAIIVPDWTVLLISGSSATGKTTLARALGRHYGVSILHMDDLRLVVEQLTTPAHHPTLHRFLSDPTIWRDAESVRDALIATAETLEPALAVVIANHLDQPEMGPVIIEGDSVLPCTANPAYAASLPQLAGRLLTDRARAIGVYEANEDALFAAMAVRRRGFAQYTDAEQQGQAQGKWLYGEWLRVEAARYDVPVLIARPYNTVVARALRILNE